MTDAARGTRETRTRPRGPVLAAVTLGFAVIQLDVSVVNVAVKAIGSGLGGGVTGVQWVVDAYTVALAALGMGMPGQRPPPARGSFRLRLCPSGRSEAVQTARPAAAAC